MGPLSATISAGPGAMVPLDSALNLEVSFSLSPFYRFASVEMSMYHLDLEFEADSAGNVGIIICKM